MRCSTYRLLRARQPQGGLSARQRLALAQHEAQCPRCAAHAASHDATVQQLSTSLHQLGSAWSRQRGGQVWAVVRAHLAEPQAAAWPQSYGRAALLIGVLALMLLAAATIAPPTASPASAQSVSLPPTAPTLVATPQRVAFGTRAPQGTAGTRPAMTATPALQTPTMVLAARRP